MTQTSEILTFTEIDAELFQHDDGEFPDYITIVTLDEVDEVVTDTIKRMLFFFREHSDVVKVVMAFAHEIGSEDGEDNIVLTPSMLVLVLSYNEERKRIICLELATSKEAFSVH